MLKLAKPGNSPCIWFPAMSRSIKLLMRKSGVKMVEVTTMGSIDCIEIRLSRYRAITVLEWKRVLQMTLSQLQQSELEFHDSKSISRLSNERELVVLMSEDLNWRRACFWSSGQQREGIKKKSSVSSRLRALSAGHYCCVSFFFVGWL